MLLHLAVMLLQNEFCSILQKLKITESNLQHSAKAGKCTINSAAFCKSSKVQYSATYCHPLKMLLYSLQSICCPLQSVAPLGFQALAKHCVKWSLVAGLEKCRVSNHPTADAVCCTMPLEALEIATCLNGWEIDCHWESGPLDFIVTYSSRATVVIIVPPTQKSYSSPWWKCDNKI